MEMFFTKTVTIYNQESSGDVLDADVWHKTVLHGVRVLNKHSHHLTTGGVEVSDAVQLHIMTDNLTKPYLEPAEWTASADKDASWTIQPGKDFFVEGDTSTEDERASDFYEIMRAKYSRCYKVTQVDTYDLIPHIEVAGQ